MSVTSEIVRLSASQVKRMKKDPNVIEEIGDERSTVDDVDLPRMILFFRVLGLHEVYEMSTRSGLIVA